MLSCQLIPMMRISRRSCLKVQEGLLNTTDFTDERGQRFMDAPFDHSTYILMEIALRVFLTGILATFGVISNIINLIIFYRQGILSNSPTVSLTALAVSDFFCCFFNVWGAVCGMLKNFTDVSQYKWEVEGFLIFTAVRPLDMFTQITCWVTAFTAFERLISVVFPFKVKAIFTPKRSLTVQTSIFLVTFVLYIPNSFEEIPVWEIETKNNFTYLGWDKSGLRSPNIRRSFFYMCPVILRLASILAVSLCNILIFWKVNLSQKFRKSSASTSHKSKAPSVKVVETTKSSGTTPSSPPLQPSTLQQQFSDNGVGTNYEAKEKSKIGSKKSQKDSSPHEGSSTGKSTSSNNKDMKLLKMITVISTVFVSCYTMNVVYVLLYYIVWKWGVDYHGYVDHIGWLVVTFFQTVNSSSNILIYQTMSSKFREDLRLLCSPLKKRML